MPVLPSSYSYHFWPLQPPSLQCLKPLGGGGDVRTEPVCADNHWGVNCLKLLTRWVWLVLNMHIFHLPPALLTPDKGLID